MIESKHFIRIYAGSYGCHIIEEAVVVCNEGKVMTVRIGYDREGVFRDGRIIRHGKPQQITDKAKVWKAYKGFSAIAKFRKSCDNVADFEDAIYAAEQEFFAKYIGKYFRDRNYPGIVYLVPITIIAEFLTHMRGEGAAIEEAVFPCDGEIVEKVKAVHETRQRWGLEIEEED